MVGRCSMILLKGEPREFLQEALGNGLLNGEALQAVQVVMRENQHLRDENSILKGMLAGRREVIQAYRAEHLTALKYQFDKEEGWRYSREHRWQMIFAAVSITVALTSLVFSLALFL